MTAIGNTDRVLAPLRRIHRAAGGTLADLALYLLSGAFAGITWLTSTQPAHRVWGGVAVIGYLALAVLTLVLRLMHRAGRGPVPAVRMAVVFAGWVATTLVPLVIEAVQRAGGAPGRAQDEVSVVEMAGSRLVDTGSPYLSHDGILHALPSLGYLAYVPYNPGIALFGLPRRYAGDVWWADARIWFAVVTAAALIAALVLLRGRVSGALLVRAAQVATVLPTTALALATGGDDLPVLALTLLALALASRRYWLLAGLIAGDAAALKLFAWPVLVLLAGLVVARAGRDAAVRYLVPALAVPILTLLPVALRDPGGVLENLIRYPLGLGLAKSSAASNFPGHLLAVLVPHGGTIATFLLAVVALVVVGQLFARPPADAGAVARRATVAMLAAILLAPASRFGYLLYPAAYGVWAVALARVTEPADAEGPAAENLPDGLSATNA